MREFTKSVIEEDIEQAQSPKLAPSLKLSVTSQLLRRSEEALMRNRRSQQPSGSLKLDRSSSRDRRKVADNQVEQLQRSQIELRGSERFARANYNSGSVNKLRVSTKSQTRLQVAAAPLDSVLNDASSMDFASDAALAVLN